MFSVEESVCLFICLFWGHETEASRICYITWLLSQWSHWESSVTTKQCNRQCKLMAKERQAVLLHSTTFWPQSIDSLWSTSPVWSRLSQFGYNWYIKQSCTHIQVCFDPVIELTDHFIHIYVADNSIQSVKWDQNMPIDSLTSELNLSTQLFESCVEGTLPLLQCQLYAVR